MNYPSALLTVWHSTHFILCHGMISAQTIFAPKNICTVHPEPSLFAHIISLHAGSFFMLLLSSADLFQNYFFQKILSGTQLVYQMAWTQIRTDIVRGKLGKL